MAGMTWLHLSDWHQKEEEFDRNVVRDALIEDIRQRARISADLAKLDFVIFSGDVAFSGKAAEYQAVAQHLFTPLMEATGLGKNQIFIVPGNHDINSTAFDLLPNGVTKPFSSKEQVNEWLLDTKKRTSLLGPFEAYIQFVHDFIGQNDPGYANIHMLEVNGKHIALLGINSALMCRRHKEGKDVKDYGYLTVGEPQVYEPLRQIADAEIRIGVIHHPFDWLAEFDRNLVENRLRRECHFILRGHMHVAKVSIEQGTEGDCVIIPAGASYDKRNYANAYNFVHLDFATGQGTVYLRRWSENRSAWIEDIDSRENGQFPFHLPKSLGNLPLQSVPSVSVPPPVDKLSESKQATEFEDTRERHNFNEATSSLQQSVVPVPIPPVSSEVISPKTSYDNFLGQARNDVEEAQKYVKQAYEIFNEKKSTIPKQFREAKSLLERANKSIHHLYTLLAETRPLPESVVSKHMSIIGQINIATDQIENHLLLSLDQQFLGNFTPLANVLKQIDAFIPKGEEI